MDISCVMEYLLHYIDAFFHFAVATFKIFCFFLFLLIFPAPPSIRTSGPAERAVVLRKPISLECFTNGIPAPGLTWLKDGRPVDTSRGNLKVWVLVSYIIPGTCKMPGNLLNIQNSFNVTAGICRQGSEAVRGKVGGFWEVHLPGHQRGGRSSAAHSAQCSW